MRLYLAIRRLVLFAIRIIENREISMGNYRLRQFAMLCRHGDGDEGGGDAEARRDITSARGGPLHSSTDFSACGAQPSREAFVEPKHKQSNRQHQHMPPP
jgi:hypothetical protein